MALIRHCGDCAGELPANARFCPGCGRAITGDDLAPGIEESIGRALSTELRNITVVFCDLVGSTELSATTDAEEYSDLIQAYQQRAVTIVRGLGGDVEGYSGDGILFRFGWPQAHDDDAAQALVAALGIVESMDELHESRRLAIRIGVHSGPAVVGELGGADRRATMAVGETLNVSARLQSAAAPGTVVASAATIDQVVGRFDVTPLGPLALRGITEPVTAYRVDGRAETRSRIEAMLDRHTPLVGRDDELDILMAQWERTRAGHGGAVLLTGEPGVGKSRLVLQLRDLISHDDHLWAESGSSPYTRMTVLRPVVELLEHVLGFHTDPDPLWRLEQIRFALEDADVDVPGAEGLIATLLGMPDSAVLSMSGDLRLERTIEVLVEWVIALSRQHPMVLVCEDLHWCDPTTLDALHRMLVRVADAPLLVVMTARPEFRPEWESPDLVTTVPLEPLDDVEVREMVSSLGDGRRLPLQVVDRIVASAGGIPLFVEEVGRSVLESGMLVSGADSWDLVSPLLDLEIPGTLQGSLLARLDGLGPAKSVAQLAAVVGRTFSFDLLVTVSGMEPALVGRLLDRVVGSGLILHDGAPREGEYSFKHALVQDVAYESLLRRNRRTIHERVARVLEDRLDTGGSTSAELVAHHFEAADLPHEAAVHYKLAASMAAERSGHREAASFLRQGIELARQLPDSVEGRELEVEMQLALGASIATTSYADPELGAAYGRARELCEQLQDDVRVGQALGGLSVYYINRGEIALGAELAERTLTIAADYDDELLQVLGSVQLALARSFQGRARETFALAERAIATYHPDRHHVLGRQYGTDQGVAAHVLAGWSRLVLGELDAGIGHLEDALALADRLGQPFNRVYALFFLASGHGERGESAQALALAEEARILADEQGFAFWSGLSGVWESSERIISLGETERLDAVIQAVFAAAATGNLGGSSNVLGQVAEAALIAGDPTLTQGILDTALAVSADTGQPWWDATLLRLQAELHATAAEDGEPTDLEDPEHPWGKAADASRRALAAADAMGYPVHGARAAATHARLLARVGRADEARELLAGWHARCPEGHDTPVLVAVRSQLDELAAPTG